MFIYAVIDKEFSRGTILLERLVGSGCETVALKEPMVCSIKRPCPTREANDRAAEYAIPQPRNRSKR
jgi:hypothetical protein